MANSDGFVFSMTWLRALKGHAYRWLVHGGHSYPWVGRPNFL